MSQSTYPPIIGKASITSMSFTIFYKAPYVDYQCFTPYEGWEESEDEDEKELIQELLECKSQEEFHEIVSDEGFEDRLLIDDYGYAGTAIWNVGDLWVDNEKYGQQIFRKENCELSYFSPEIEEIIPGEISRKFCVVKAWENSGQWSLYVDESEFDFSKVTYGNGRVLYAGEEFEFNDGDGSSSYWEYYWDGSSRIEEYEKMRKQRDAFEITKSSEIEDYHQRQKNFYAWLDRRFMDAWKRLGLPHNNETSFVEFKQTLAWKDYQDKVHMEPDFIDKWKDVEYHLKWNDQEVKKQMKKIGTHPLDEFKWEGKFDF